MKTLWMLIARYEGLPVVPVDLVARDFFSHLDVPKFVRKVNEGQIDIPLVHIENSQKAAKGVSLVDLAAYLDRQIASARAENAKLFGRPFTGQGSTELSAPCSYAPHSPPWTAIRSSATA